MNLTDLYMKIFGTDQFLGINMGFWLSMAISVLVVLIQNLTFWTMKPRYLPSREDHNDDA